MLNFGWQKYNIVIKLQIYITLCKREREREICPLTVTVIFMPKNVNNFPFCVIFFWENCKSL